MTGPGRYIKVEEKWKEDSAEVLNAFIESTESLNIYDAASTHQVFQDILKKKGIPTAIFYPLPLHLQECFKYLNYKEGDFPISEAASRKVISLPMNSFLTHEQLVYIVNNIKENIS